MPNIDEMKSLISNLMKCCPLHPITATLANLGLVLTRFSKSRANDVSMLFKAWELWFHIISMGTRNKNETIEDIIGYMLFNCNLVSRAAKHVSDKWQALWTVPFSHQWHFSGWLIFMLVQLMTMLLTNMHQLWILRMERVCCPSDTTSSQYRRLSTNTSLLFWMYFNLHIPDLEF